MKVEILMIGKIGEKPYKQLIDQYLGRCGKRLNAKIIHCKDADEMVKRLKGHTCIIAMDEHVESKDTMGFSKWLKKKIHGGENKLTFCLGASAGLDKRVKEMATEFISLSPLTLNHQLALLVLAEQLYRSISIMFGEPYHKA
jgi:23S rRNA (pseudouridine1915-N3)-methyltransferase